MLFNSWQFCLFFPVVTTLYFLLGPRARRWMLLAASCLFYMAFIPAYILILAATIGVDYVAGRAIGASTGHRRKLWLGASIAVNLGALAFFKYFNFFNANLAALAGLLHWNYGIQALSIALPIGLSFHTFQSLAYTIEVYRGRQEPERHLGVLALYVLFYPQLVAGPIERPQSFLPQLHAEQAFEYRRATAGLRLMLWGFFQKMVIADRVAAIVDPVFKHPHAYTGIPLAIAAVLFSFQIYCDFAGYSNIAIGAARVMGFELMTNFRHPYFSRSVQEFWTRWHVSLSSWFRDYMYIPLGGNRVSRPRRLANLAAVFLVSGLWHGAAWTYVVWGALHAAYMVVGVSTAAWRERLPTAPAPVRIALTFALVTFAWIFFRAGSLPDAWYIASHLAAGWPAQLASGGALKEALHLGGTRTQLVIAVLAIAAMLLCERHPEAAGWLQRRPVWVRWPVYYAAILVVLVMGVYDGRTFIYFQF